MNSTKLSLSVLFAWLLLIAASSRGVAQAPIDGALDTKTRDRAIEEICTSFRDTYIFEEIAAQCAKKLEQRHAAHAYDNLDANAFCATITDDLQSICHDLHVRVRPAPPRPADPTPEEISAMRAERRAQNRRGNYGFRRVEILPGNVGYIDLRGFSDASEGGETAVAAMQFLSGSEALIFDLRRNGGGSPSMIQLISTYLFEDRTHLNSFEERTRDDLRQFWTLPHVPGRRMPDVPVYVLTSRRTFSAAEEFTYNLKHLGRATIVGETTGGGAHPGGTHRIADRFSIFIPDGRAVNPITGTNWEGVGVKPHIDVPQQEALDRAHLEALRTLSKKAGPGDGILAWAIIGLEAKTAPATFTASQLGDFAGDYGPRHITLEGNTLLYRRDGTGSPPARLLPLTGEIFGVEGAPFFRVRFVRADGGTVTKIIGLYEDGRSDESPRTE